MNMHFNSRFICYKTNIGLTDITSLHICVPKFFSINAKNAYTYFYSADNCSNINMSTLS